MECFEDDVVKISLCFQFSCGSVEFSNSCTNMASTIKLLTLFIVPITCFNIERQLNIWCQEPLKSLDLSTKYSNTNIDFHKKTLEHRCGIWLRHIPNKTWTSDITELFRQPLKTKLRVLKISDGVQRMDENLFTLESTLKYLDLSGNDLDYLPMPEVKPKSVFFMNHNIFYYLYALDLSKNKFTNISFMKAKMPILKELDLSDNRFREIPLGTLRNFEELEKLILKKNNITTLQNSVEYANIEYLDLSENYLTDLIGCQKFPNLKILIVSHNKIRVIDANSLKDGIWSLGSLHLDNNNISEITVDAFRYFPNLKTLKLNNNRILRLETGIFSVLNSLESLDVSNNLITSLDADLFSTNKKLSVLNLNNNLIETLNYVHMVDLCPSLGEIDILENSFRCDFFDSMFSFFLNKNILVPGGTGCLIRNCCKTETTTIPNEDEGIAMKITNKNSGIVNSEINELSFNISQFFLSMEQKSDSFLKLFVYQFAFIVCVALLILIIYVQSVW